jgi:hypothetical protein
MIIILKISNLNLKNILNILSDISKIKIYILNVIIKWYIYNNLLILLLMINIVEYNFN